MVCREQSDDVATEYRPRGTELDAADGLTHVSECNTTRLRLRLCAMPSHPVGMMMYERTRMLREHPVELAT
eukprot:748309-Hanusia_phi.AAC.17